jgi:hypothetical protein
MPICTPCVTLVQQCTYGVEPKKRGLAPGSVSALEKSVQLLQRLFGLLFKNVEGSELAVLALVREYGERLVNDGEEGKSLSKVWVDGLLPAALEPFRQGQRRQTTPGSFSQSKATVQRGVRSFLREREGPEGARREDPGPTEKYGLEVSRQQRGDVETASSNLQMSPGWIGELDVQAPNLPGPMRNEALTTLGSAESGNIITPLGGSDTVEVELVFPNAISPTPISPDAVAPYYPAPASSWGRLNQSSSAKNQRQWHLADEEATSGIQTYLAEHDFSGQDLPRTSRLLLDLYFTYTHVWLPILDKYDLICFFHTVESSASDSNSKRECMTGKRALLSAVLALASLQHYEEPYVPERHVAPSMYMASQKLLFTPGEDSCLEHVQALLILVLYNVSLSHLRPAWLLLGHAGRLSIDLGLNVASTSQFGNRTWQGYLVLDTIVSALMNRDSGLRDNDWEVPVVEETGWEEWDSWKEMNIAMVHPLASMESSGDDTPARILSRFNILVGLSRLLRRTTLFLPPQQTQLRRPRNATRSPEDPDHCGALRHLGLQLDLWKQTLLSHTPPDFFALQPQTTTGNTSSEPHASNLCIFYLYVTQQVVARCFCCCRDSSTAIHHDEVWRKSMAVPMASRAKRILDSFRHLRKPELLSCLFVHIGIHLAESLDPGGLLPGQTKDLLTDFKRLTIHQGFRNTNGLLKQADRIQRELPKRTPLAQVTPFDRNGPNTTPSRDPLDSTFISGGVVSSPSASFVPGTTTSASRSEPLTRSNAVDMAINTEPTGAASGGSPPLYDAFDEEMGMLESLSWYVRAYVGVPSLTSPRTHNGIPEFMHNLGYTFGSPQSSRHGAQVEEARDSGNTSASLRLGFHPSLEYWLGDMLGSKEHGLD